MYPVQVHVSDDCILHCHTTAVMLIVIQFVSIPAKALVAPHGVGAAIITATDSQGTLINIYIEG